MEPTEDQGSTHDGFARLLANADPDVFGGAEKVEEIFDSADEHFLACGGTMKLGSVCTQSENTPCWAARVQPAWNDLFNPRAVEMIQLHKGTYHFRTLHVDPEKLSSDDDVKFLCLYLWLLRQHRCISGVVFSLSVVAPRHGSLFMSLLRLTPSVQKFEMRINDPFKGPCLPLEQSWLHALDSLSQLRELGLCNMCLSGSDVAILTSLVERSKFLVALILIDVAVIPAAFLELTTKVGRHKTLQDVRIKTTATAAKLVFMDALSQIGKSPSLDRLYVHVDCGLIQLLNGFHKTRLCYLTIEPAIRDANVLAALADLLVRAPSIEHLKVCLDTRGMNVEPRAPDYMARMIAESSLMVLVLSGSKLSSVSVRKLAGALGVSKHILELHLDECGLTAEDSMQFVGGMRKRLATGKDFDELNLGSLNDQTLAKRLFFWQVIELGLCNRITLVYDEALLPIFRYAVKQRHMFVNVSLMLEHPDRALRALTYAPERLRCLCVNADKIVPESFARSLRHIIRNAPSLQELRLRCVTSPETTKMVLRTLTRCQSVVNLTIGNWWFDQAAEEQLVYTFTMNRSLKRIEVHCSNVCQHSAATNIVERGVSHSPSVWITEAYYGPERLETSVPPGGRNRTLQANEMAVSWATDVILSQEYHAAGSGLTTLLDVCEASLELFKRSAYFMPRPCGKRAPIALMATRTMFYSLYRFFGGEKEFIDAPDGIRRFKQLLAAVRPEALNVARSGTLMQAEEPMDVD